MTIRATIQDVAQAAGVSIKSVSRVINREPNVRDSLRVKVEQAIDALGYVPNLAARSLAAGRTFVIGLLFDNPSPNYIMKVQEGAYAACRRRGYQLAIEHIDCSVAGVASTMETILRNSRLDAMVITPPVTECPAVLQALDEHGIRYARLTPNDTSGASCSVAVDDRGAVGEVVLHLWGLGHRRFAIVNGPPNHGASGRRRDGFFHALAQQGIPPDPIREAQGDFSFQSGIDAGLLLLQAAERPTAIFAANDDMAAGVFAAAAQLGIQIPADLSVVGFDDSWVARSVWPELTTIHQPIAEMADVAVEMLIAQQAGTHLALDYSLIVRASTGVAAVS